MGKTVPAYRMALEEEISSWSGFVRALHRSDREGGDELIDMCRSYASAGGNATNPILFEPFVISIILGQQERIRKLEKGLQAIKPDATAASTGQESKETDPVKPKITIPTARATKLAKLIKLVGMLIHTKVYLFYEPQNWMIFQ